MLEEYVAENIRNPDINIFVSLSPTKPVETWIVFNEFELP